MKKTLIVSSLLIFLLACKKDFSEQSIRGTEIRTTNNLTFTDTAAQFGVFIQKAFSDTMPVGSAIVLDDSVQVKLDSTYGAKNIRLAINKPAWDSVVRRNSFLINFKSIWKKGFAIALNINYYGNGTIKPFADSIDYKNFVTAVLDSIAGRSDSGQTMKPNMVVVENEETNPGYYYDTTITLLSKYVGMLRQTASVCSSRGILTTNGGIVCQLSLELTWDYLRTKYDTSVANTWARKVMTNSVVNQLNSGARDSDITLGTYLVTAYKGIPNLSYINIHWYEPVIARYWPEGGASPYDAPYNVNPNNYVISGIDSVVKYYNNTATNLKLISNETGQLTYSNALTNQMVNKFVQLNKKGNFNIVIWYDGDGKASEIISGAKALHNATSTTTYSLRISGTKFQQKMH